MCGHMVFTRKEMGTHARSIPTGTAEMRTHIFPGHSRYAGTCSVECGKASLILGLAIPDLSFV